MLSSKCTLWHLSKGAENVSMRISTVNSYANRHGLPPEAWVSNQSKSQQLPHSCHAATAPEGISCLEGWYCRMQGPVLRKAIGISPLSQNPKTYLPKIAHS